MKKLLIIVLMSMCVSTLFAQTEEMKTVVNAAKDELIDDMWEIVEEGYFDISVFTEISTDTLTIDAKYKYAIVLTVDDCMQCGSWIAYRANGVDVTLGSDSEQIENIHKVFATINEEETISGQIIGCVKTRASHKAHLLVVRK